MRCSVDLGLLGPADEACRSGEDRSGDLRERFVRLHQLPRPAAVSTLCQPLCKLDAFCIGRSVYGCLGLCGQIHEAV